MLGATNRLNSTTSQHRARGEIRRTRGVTMISTGQYPLLSVGAFPRAPAQEEIVARPLCRSAQSRPTGTSARGWTR
jgi:hypothetical protein